MTRDFETVAGAPDEAGGRALAGVLAAHGIPAELHDAGSGFVDIEVPRAFRDEARRLLKAHLTDLAREEEPVLVAVAPDQGAGYGMTGALQAAGIPAFARPGRYGPSVCVYVPHGMSDAATEFLALLEGELAAAEAGGDERADALAADAAGGSEIGAETRAPSEAEAIAAPRPGEAGAEPADQADAEPADEVHPADDGPPAFGSDLQPDFGDAFGPTGGGF